MSTQACSRARSTAIATLPSLQVFFSQGRRSASSDVASLATELAGLAAASTHDRDDDGRAGESEGPRRKYDAMIARGELRQDSRQVVTVDQLERVYQDLVASRQSRSGSGLTLVDASSSTKQTRRRTGWWGSIVDSLGDNSTSSAPLAPRGLYMYGGPGCGMSSTWPLVCSIGQPRTRLPWTSQSIIQSQSQSLTQPVTQSPTHSFVRQGKPCLWTCLPRHFPVTWPRGWRGCTTTTLCWTCTSLFRNIVLLQIHCRRLLRILPQNRASSAWTSSSSTTLPTPRSCIVCSTICGTATSPWSPPRTAIPIVSTRTVSNGSYFFHSLRWSRRDACVVVASSRSSCLRRPSHP